MVSLTRSYVKDANHFLARLDKLGKIPEGALICNVNVVRRYPSIPHGEANFGSDEGIKPKQEKQVSRGENYVKLHRGFASISLCLCGIVDWLLDPGDGERGSIPR